MRKNKLNSKNPIIFILIGVIIICVALLGFYIGKNMSLKNSSTQELELPEDISEIDSVIENILQSLNNNDYNSFSKDFSSTLKNALDEQLFQETRDLVLSASGNYISKQTPKLFQTQGYYSYEYPCTFEKEEVKTTIYFKPDGKTTVEGLFFDSENIRNEIQS